jgi:hypothetical protein
MKRLIIACALAVASIAPSVFAGAPKLPADIATWESLVLTCTPKPSVNLTITVYAKKSEYNFDLIEIIDKQGKRVAQLEFLSVDTMKFTWRNKGSWVTQNFTDDKDESEKFYQEFKTALGISIDEYASCFEK